jgi:hypothetical protein
VGGGYLTQKMMKEFTRGRRISYPKDISSNNTIFNNLRRTFENCEFTPLLYRIKFDQKLTLQGLKNDN